MLTKSKEANMMIAALKAIPVGGSITSKDLERESGVGLGGKFPSKGALATARMALMHSDGIVFRVISGELCRLTDEQKVSEAARRETLAQRGARSARLVAQSVDDYNALSVESKDVMNRVVVRTTVMSNLAKPSVTNNLIAAIQSRGGASALSADSMVRLLASAV